MRKVLAEMKKNHIFATSNTCNKCNYLAQDGHLHIKGVLYALVLTC